MEGVMSQTRTGEARRVAPGGPAAINGVLYQLLWSLFELSNARIEAAKPGADGAIQKLTIALEPSDGGDLRLGPRVDQIKARPQRTAWSLKEVIQDVIPDLYAASRQAPPGGVYRFVTEGKMGPWQRAYEFFQSFGKSPDGPPVKRSALNNTRTVFRPTSGSRFWKLEEYTERTLYDLIVEQVRKRKAIRAESAKDTFEKLQGVLGAFEFLGDQTEDCIRKKIDRELLGFVDSWEDVTDVRRRMIADLLERAVAQAEISGEPFFASHGLDGPSLTDWTNLRGRAREFLTHSSQPSSYEATPEARPDDAPKKLGEWPSDSPVMLLHGKSGQGKTWLAYSLAEAVLAWDRDLAVMVPAQGDLDKTLAYAGRRIWRDIRGRSTGEPSLAQIGDYVQKVLEKPNCRWLTLVIDDVKDRREAVQLVGQPWAKWGVRVIITCQTQVAKTLPHESLGSTQQVEVGDFTERELGRYLQEIIGDHWLAMPEDVRKPLRTPIIADTFRQVVAKRKNKGWLPQTEYEIFQQRWKELEYTDGGIAALEPLVQMVIEGSKYPWDESQIREAQVDFEAVKRLKQARWLHSTMEGDRKCYAVPHERLLSWAVAEILVSDLRHSRIEVGELGGQLRSYLFGDLEPGRFWLGYVGMDALWIAVSEKGLESKIPVLLRTMEPTAENQIHGFYGELIPTIGERIVPALLCRLRECDDRMRQSYVLRDAIRNIGGNPAAVAGAELIREERSTLRDAGARILKHWPTDEAIEDLWELSIQLEETDTANLGSRHEVSRALNACVRSKPGWIDHAIEDRKGGAKALPKLVWLIHGLPLEDGLGLWRKHKTRLVAEVPPKHARCVGACFGRFREESGAAWLIEKLSDSEDWIAGAALQGLARISPRQAIQHLHKVPEAKLYLWRHWFADQLLHADAVRTREKLRSIFQHSDRPWQIAEIYRGREHWVDRDTIDLLLDRLAVELDEVLVL